jgi:hypothetical protein
VLALTHWLVVSLTTPLFTSEFGGDFGLFWTAARLLLAGRLSDAYHMPALAQAWHPLVAGAAGVPDMPPPAPYPPFFFALLVPLTWIPASIAYAVWVGLSIAAVALVARRYGPTGSWGRWLRPLLVLTFWPLLWGICLGQPIAFLLYAFQAAYDAWRARHDFRSGLWLSLLLVKPQYVLFLVLVLLGKRRWAALCGLAVAGVTCVALSIAVAGAEGITSYLSLLLDLAHLQSQSGIGPEWMIGWRGLMASLLPQGHETAGLIATGLLSVLTVSSLWVIWRGDWQPTSRHFATQVLATMLVTMLVSFHNHLHGAAFLLVPGLALAAPPLESAHQRKVAAILAVGALLPPILVATLGSVPAATPLLTAMMGVALAMVVIWKAGGVVNALPATRRMPLGSPTTS